MWSCVAVSAASASFPDRILDVAVPNLSFALGNQRQQKGRFFERVSDIVSAFNQSHERQPIGAVFRQGAGLYACRSAWRSQVFARSANLAAAFASRSCPLRDGIADALGKRMAEGRMLAQHIELVVMPSGTAQQQQADRIGNQRRGCRCRIDWLDKANASMRNSLVWTAPITWSRRSPMRK
jgi:hypothetical protein